MIAAAAFAVGVVAGSPTKDGEDSAPADAELPGGGTRIFPDRRVVAFYGAPQDPALGALGVGSPGQALDELRRQATAYERPDRPVLPALELIATVANAHPGEAGLYNTPQPKSVIRHYLKAARSSEAIMLLDIQPGRADFMSEVMRLEEFLLEPDVSLALDPEWHVGLDGIPGEVLGSVSAEQVNEVSRYLQNLVELHDLPQKLLVVHQFTDGMILDKEELLARPDVAVTLNVDGFGDRANKVAKYRQLRPSGPIEGLPTGFKLFYSEDLDVMTPGEVLGLRPRPDFVVYE